MPESDVTGRAVEMADVGDRDLRHLLRIERRDDATVPESAVPLT